MSDEPVRLLLDVDGVINAVGGICDDWMEWSTKRCNGYLITHSQELGRELLNLGVEIRWLTTWEELADEHIAPLFAWPRFELAGARTEADGHLYDYSQKWWKLAVAKRLYEADPKPFIWADDDLGYDREALAWAESVGALCISPKSWVGLTRRDIEEMKGYVARHRAAG